jgi:NADH dehydrogenase [ubiquinone] 1 alpha subcomplex assembly factor 7
VTPLARQIAALIAADGPMRVSDFMRHALYDPAHGYYCTRQALGAAGDFITAPEVSQIFGELLGLWCVQSWLDMGAPARVELIELGPGRGVLMADALRAACRAAPEFRAAAAVTLVEINPWLRAAQGERLAGAQTVRWTPRLADAPPGPSLILANEFLDCLAIRQFVRTQGGWRERLVGLDAAGELAFGLAATPTPEGMIPAVLRDSPTGSLVEISPGLQSIVLLLQARFDLAPGRALFIDYGASAPSPGDTLQAMRAHRRRHPLEAPGETDVTAHVDFAALAAHARVAGLTVAGPVTQAAFLGVLGVAQRGAALARANPNRCEEILAGVARLTDADGMGVLFKAICLSSPGLAPAVGFQGPT